MKSSVPEALTEREIQQLLAAVDRHQQRLLAMEDVAEEKPPIHELLTATGDYVCYGGDTGSLKSSTVWKIMTELSEQNPDYIHVNVFSDHPEEQTHSWAQQAGLTKDNCVMYDISKDRNIEFCKFLVDIKQKTAGRKVGIVSLDPAPVVLRKLFMSVTGNFFTPIDDECAELAVNQIVKVIANELNCVVVLIGHAVKNKAGLHRYPGSVQTEAIAGIGGRFYNWTMQTAESLPKGIVQLFEAKPAKERDKYSFLSILKHRYLHYHSHIKVKHPVYEIVRNKSGRIDWKLVEVQVDVSSGNSKDSFVDVKPEEYLKLITPFLQKNPEKRFGFKELNRQIKNHPKMNYWQWYGIVVGNTFQHENVPWALSRNTIFHTLYKSKHPLVYITPSSPSD